MWIGLAVRPRPRGCARPIGLSRFPPTAGPEERRRRGPSTPEPAHGHSPGWAVSLRGGAVRIGLRLHLSLHDDGWSDGWARESRRRGRSPGVWHEIALKIGGRNDLAAVSGAEGSPGSRSDCLANEADLAVDSWPPSFKNLRRETIASCSHRLAGWSGP